MQIEIRQYEQRDAAQAAEIWNEVVEDGKAFPQMEKLDEVTGHAFFTEQTYTGVAYDLSLIHIYAMLRCSSARRRKLLNWVRRPARLRFSRSRCV